MKLKVYTDIATAKLKKKISYKVHYALEITLVEVDFPFGDKPEQERPTFKGRLHICGKTTTHAVDYSLTELGLSKWKSVRRNFSPSLV